MRRLYIIGALAFLGWMPVSAQQWTLSRCIEYALEHNIQVKQQEVNVSQQEISLSTSRSSRLPGVSASSSESVSLGRGLTADNTYANTNTSSTSFSIGADVPVFQGFRINRDIAMKQLNLAAATADLAKAKDDIRVAVAQAYVQILYNNEIVSVAESQVELDSLQLVRLTEMHRSGKTSAAEVARQKATLEQSRLSLTQARNNRSMAVLDLSQLLELPSPEGFEVYCPDLTDSMPLIENPELIYEQAVQVKPTVLAEQTRLDYARAGIAYAKSSFLPSISLSGGVGSNYYTASGYQNNSFASQMKNNFSQYLGLSLSIPVFSRFSNRNSVRSAQLSAKSQELALENVKKSLYKEIQQAYYNALTSQDKLRSSRQAADSAQEAFDLVKAKYENGKAAITEYNESKAALFSALSNLTQARYECQYQCKLLDFYKGEELYF